MAMRGTFLVDTEASCGSPSCNGPGEPRDQNGWRKALAALAA